MEYKSEEHGENGHLVGLDVEQRPECIPPSLPSTAVSQADGLRSSPESFTHCTSMSRSR